MYSSRTKQVENGRNSNEGRECRWPADGGTYIRIQGTKSNKSLTAEKLWCSRLGGWAVRPHRKNNSMLGNVT